MEALCAWPLIFAKLAFSAILAVTGALAIPAGDGARGIDGITNAIADLPASNVADLNESDYSAFDVRGMTGAIQANGDRSSVHFKDGTIAGCSSTGSDGVIFYPVTDYTAYLVDHYVRFVRENEELPGKVLGADIGAPDYLQPHQSQERPYVLHYSPCTDEGFAGTDFNAGRYFAIEFLHRYVAVSAAPSASDPFSTYEAAHAVRDRDGYILYNLCAIDDDGDETCKFSSMQVLAHFKG